MGRVRPSPELLRYIPVIVHSRARLHPRGSAHGGQRHARHPPPSTRRSPHAHTTPRRRRGAAGTDTPTQSGPTTPPQHRRRARPRPVDRPPCHAAARHGTRTRAAIAEQIATAQSHSIIGTGRGPPRSIASRPPSGPDSPPRRAPPNPEPAAVTPAPRPRTAERMPHRPQPQHEPPVGGRLPRVQLNRSDPTRLDRNEPPKPYTTRRRHALVLGGARQPTAPTRTSPPTPRHRPLHDSTPARAGARGRTPHLVNPPATAWETEEATPVWGGFF